MPNKRNILVLSDWYLPAYKAGGPVKSLATLVFHLKDEFNFFIITSDKDAFDEKPLPVKTDAWGEGRNGEKIFYASGKITQSRLEEIMGTVEYDCLYINSFFSKPFSIYPLMLNKKGKIKKPVVLAPRGMLRPGALAIKAGKKKLFLTLAKLTGLHKNIHWHATSAEEKTEIKKRFGNSAQITEAQNLGMVPFKKRENYSKDKGKLKICVVTRLVPNKQIDFALEVLKDIKEGEIVFDVFGPPEDPAYFEKCKQLAQTLGKNITVSFKGQVHPSEIEDVLKGYHVFLLPTQTENFGHAILEGMLNGCIPVISNQTPWKNLEKNGFGWDLDLGDKSGFINAIKKCLEMDEEAFKSQSIKIQSFALNKTAPEEVKKAYSNLFK